MSATGRDDLVCEAVASWASVNDEGGHRVDWQIREPTGSLRFAESPFSFLVISECPILSMMQMGMRFEGSAGAGASPRVYA